MSKLETTETTHEERERIVDAVMAELGETAPRKGEAWWHLYFVLVVLGRDAVAATLHCAGEVHAGAGMLVADGSRKRTRGGVFFALCRARMSAKLWRRTVNAASGAWARRCLRRLAAKGERPTTEEDFRTALARAGEEASEFGLRTLVRFATRPEAKVQPVPVVESRAALAGVLKAAAQHVTAHPERFRPKTVPPQPAMRREQGRQTGRRQVVMPSVEVLPARSRRET